MHARRTQQGHRETVNLIPGGAGELLSTERLLPGEVAEGEVQKPHDQETAAEHRQDTCPSPLEDRIAEQAATRHTEDSSPSNIQEPSGTFAQGDKQADSTKQVDKMNSNARAADMPKAQPLPKPRQWNRSYADVRRTHALSMAARSVEISTFSRHRWGEKLI